MLVVIHDLKIYERHADAVCCGDKGFEVRINDRNFQKGDIIVFHCIENDSVDNYTDHPINDSCYRITQVYTGDGVKEGFVVLGISRWLSLDGVYETYKYDQHTKLVRYDNR